MYRGIVTFFNEIKQITAGECIIYNKQSGNLSSQHYFRYIYNNFLKNNENELIGHLNNVLDNCFQRCIESTVNEGKKIVVPLSGGLDSRIIVTMLKRFGVDDVICFSYGKKNNYESKISKQIADRLDYEWHFVEYTQNNWKECYKSEGMNSYFDYSQNLVSMPHEQDFLAVKILKEKEILPKNSVFLPGHSGDLFRGHLLNKKDFTNNIFNHDKLIKTIFEKHYNLWDIHENQEILPSLFERIKKNTALFSIDNSRSYINALDYFNITERQAKYIINSVRVYEYFGYEWRLPLFEKELVDFFLTVPINQKFHDKLLVKWYNYNFNILSHIPCTTSLHNHINYEKAFSDFKDAFLNRFNSLFYNTKSIGCGNILSLNLHCDIIIKKSDLSGTQKFDPIISIILLNIQNKKRLSFNGIQTAKFLNPFVEGLDNHFKIEN